MARNLEASKFQAMVEADRRRLENTCQYLQTAEHTDFVCTAPIGHAGEHAPMVDAMFLRGLDADGHPVYYHR